MENLNKYIKERMNMLRASSYDFKGLFSIIHDQGDRVFCEFLDNYQITKVGYASFKDYCLRTASFLEKQLDSKPGAYVGIYMENSLHFLSSFWGLLMLGYKPLLLNCRLPDDLNNSICASLCVKEILTAQDGFRGEELRFVKTPSGSAFDPSIAACEPYLGEKWANEIALCTTATSMKCKICVYTGSDLTNQVLNADGVLKKNKMIKKHFEGSLKQLAFLPFYHIFGLEAVYFWFSVFGRTFVFLNDYSSDTILKTVRRHKVTHIFAVPLLWNTMAKEIKKEIASSPEKKRKKAEKGMRLSLFIQNLFPQAGQRIARRMFREVTARTLGNSVRFMISGGGYISDETLYILNAAGYPLYNGYGATEIGITSVELRKRPKDRIKGAVGKPFDLVEYDVRDGKLFVRGKASCTSVADLDKNKQIIDRGEWFDTRDLAYTDKKGFCFIKGRQDDVFIGENGEKIDPDLIEKKCLLTSVQSFCVLGLDGKLTLVFEVPHNAGELKKRTIAEEISKTLDSLRGQGCRIDRVFFTTDPLSPRNAIKVSRALLKKQIESGNVVLIPYERFRDYEKLSEEAISADTILSVKKTFAEVLGRDVRTIEDDMHFIFDLGGTSLDYCTVLIKLQNDFGVEFSFDKHSCSTAREFAKYIMKTLSGGNSNEKVQKS